MIGNERRGVSVSGTVVFSGCMFSDNGGRGIKTSARNALFENCTVADASNEPKRNTPISFAARAGCTHDVGGVEFENCTLVEPVDRPLMVFHDYTGELKVLDLTGTLRVVRDGRKQTVPITEQLLDELMPMRRLKRIPRYDVTGARFVPVFPDAKPSSIQSGLVRQRKHAEYFIYATPALFLLDSNRTILARPKGYRQFLRAVKKLETL